MFIYRNPNPVNNLVGDCVIRAISLATGQDWETTFLEIAIEGFYLYDMPSSNRVWDSYLQRNNFRRYIIPDTCPNCYTVKQFCKDNPQGTFILGTGTHVIAVIDGNYLDTWDSGDEVPLYFYKKE